MAKGTELLIAHRGESFDAPENTLAAINLAWERGIKSVEIDIQLTRDNEIVVIHDYDTFRICGEKQIIKKSSLKELLQLNAGFHKGEKWNNERIPSLNQVLQTVPEHGKLIIEIKSNSNILGKLKSELSQSKLKDSQIEIIAFNVSTLAKAKQFMPEYKMLWLLNLDYSRPSWLLRINVRKIIKKVKKLKLDGVNVRAGNILSGNFISEFKKAGLLVYAWTVDSVEKAGLLREYGINGITTNRAAWMLEQLNKGTTNNLVKQINE